MISNWFLYQRQQKNVIISAIRGEGVVSKTVDTKMLQMVRNNDISFVKTVAHDQLYHLVINKINHHYSDWVFHVAMVTPSKNPNWRPSAQVSDFIYIFLKKI